MRSEKSHCLEFFREILRLEARGVDTTAASLDESIERGVAILRACDGRVIVTGMGKSGHIARKVAATLSSTGTPAQFVHPAEAGHGDLGMITPHDVILALSHSGETAELMPILAHAKRFSIPLVGMARAGDHNLSRACDYLFALPSLTEACPLGLAPTTSSTVMLALGDAIALTLLQSKGFSQKDFAHIHPGGKLGANLLHVADIMHPTDQCPLITQDTPMKNALITMTQKHFGCLGIVNDNNHLQGIITDGDLRRHMDDQFLHKKAGQIMTHNPLMATTDQFASHALATMNENHITVLFVSAKPSSKEVVGLVHIHDCLRAGVE